MNYNKYITQKKKQNTVKMLKDRNMILEVRKKLNRDQRLLKNNWKHLQNKTAKKLALRKSEKISEQDWKK